MISLFFPHLCLVLPQVSGLPSLWFLATQTMQGMGSLSLYGLQVKPNFGWPLSQVPSHHGSSISYRQDRLQVEGPVTGLVSRFLFFLQSAEHLACEGDWNVGMKVPSLHQLDLSMFTEPCGSCPWEREPIISFQRVTICPNISVDGLGISVEPPQTTNKNRKRKQIFI